jgi:nitroreductase
MELGEAIRTTGSVRRFTDEVIDDATVHAILDDARFAPSGGNRQGWRVVVVKDPAIRAELGRVMRPVWDEYVAIGSTGVTPFSSVAPGGGAPASSPTIPPGIPNEIIDGILDVPVVLVVAVDLSLVAMMDRDLEREPIAGGGSIYPFCWNLLLAARSRCLGGVLTTFLARAEREAAPLLALPANHAIAGMVFLGRPVHQPTRLKREPVSSFTTIDTFVGPALDLESEG